MRSNGVRFMLAVLVAAVHGQLQVLFEDEVAAIAKSVNELAENPSIARNVRQPQIFTDPIENLPNGALLNTRIQNDGGQHHHHQDGAHSHTHLTRLDVTCSSGNMRVELEFDGPYNGIVYSKGHAANRRCRFINKDSARGSFNFVVPIDSCGPVGDERRGTDETILVFQNDDSVIEVWDVARRIQCPKVERKIVKTITFNPFTVGRILVEEGPTPNETVVECWMDILVGENPCRGKTAKDKVKIGDDMSAVIYVKDGGSNYDILVKDCFAHDQAQLSGRDTTSVQLSDSSGCLKKEKLLGQFRKYPQTCSGADLVAYAPMSAFKFADRPSVYLTCVVELCPGQCDQCGVPTNRSTVSVCPTELHGVDPKCPPFVCTPQLVGRDSRCPTPPPPPTTAFVCTPRLRGRDPRCPTPPPPTPPPTPAFVCTPRLAGRDPRCPTPTPPPTTPTPRTTPTFVCTPRLLGRDPRCPTPPPPTPPPTAFVCTPRLAGRDPRCPTPSPPPPPPPPVTPKFVCTPELKGKDANCPDENESNPPPTTRLNCELNPSDPRCKSHPFHVRLPGKGSRRRPTGSLPKSFIPAPSARRRRDVRKNIVITGISSGFKYA
ncbi:uncharacterized protein LOC135941994 [Cloeon dipterum]|uniref:uncharacterized protein LOC135941994 n=1 Tax=Cloeon dipterum TaxID=197152 RepID=UPI00322044EE